MRFTIRLAMAGVVTGLLLTACGTATGPAPGSSGRTSPAPATSAPATATSPQATSPAPAPFAYLMLFPFSSLTQIQAWQASFASGGHQPWHLNAGETAIAFAAHLGFPAIDKVAGQTGTVTDAHVAVGFTLPNGKIGTAAIVHMVRWGAGRYRPWEVVGTDDTTLTLDQPGYGSTVTSPVRIGGTISGVDENLRADVHILGTAGAVGSYCCQPAGGQHSPWSLTVPFRAPSGSVLTIAVHTGGHVAPVERFAVTGVRAR